MAPFRFLDLPPEMRNRVYEASLVHNRGSGLFATLGLLTVCKQIHAEAKGIFYGLSTFTINMKPEKVLVPGKTFGYLRLTGDANADLDGDGTSAMKLRSLLPPQLSQVSEIKVNIEIRPMGLFTGTTFYQPWVEAGNLFLYAMVQHLNSGKSKCKLLVEVCDKATFTARRICYVLSSLAFLHTRVDLQLSGIPQMVRRELQPDLDFRSEVPDEAVDPIISYLAREQKMYQTLDEYHPALNHKVSLKKAALYSLAVLDLVLYSSEWLMDRFFGYLTHLYTLALQAIYVALHHEWPEDFEHGKQLVRGLFPLREEYRDERCITTFCLQVLTPLSWLFEINREEWFA